eukprot:TRINITY_DN4163_c1_g1_i2.p1 TRINITY_DN4163_c1_g1~~TRINITY_DN4163_c1_g1_i2.p1  ORF type:complete len:240 (+),score=22.48 TRINITY_DN4163_c1_g1_i2:117-836(+)
MQAVIQEAHSFVQESLAKDNVDSSHDYWHIFRVRNLALTLADKEGLSEEQKEIVELAALLHDVKDWKYSGNENDTLVAVKKFLDSQIDKITEFQKEKVLDIISRIGFKDELKRQQEQNGQHESFQIRKLTKLPNFKRKKYWISFQEQVLRTNQRGNKNRTDNTKVYKEEIIKNLQIMLLMFNTKIKRQKLATIQVANLDVFKMLIGWMRLERLEQHDVLHLEENLTVYCTTQIFHLALI